MIMNSGIRDVLTLFISRFHSLRFPTTTFLHLIFEEDVERFGTEQLTTLLLRLLQLTHIKWNHASQISHWTISLLSRPAHLLQFWFITVGVTLLDDDSTFWIRIKRYLWSNIGALKYFGQLVDEIFNSKICVNVGNKAKASQQHLLWQI